ncbi:MAG: accessory factor UbiK family protein [Acidiphilium sp.]|nr:accessory factor UbiK family protein [Acidiphilium sp.]MDD4934946.1 accessory factor UbiK family protein [Acidiphilium sp.]
MSERPKFFDDLAGVAGGALSAFSGLRDELTALIRARVDEAIRKLDLVRREEFDVVAELAAKARAEAGALAARVAALEDMIATAPMRDVDTPAMPEITEPPKPSASSLDQDSNTPS